MNSDEYQSYRNDEERKRSGKSSEEIVSAGIVESENNIIIASLWENGTRLEKIVIYFFLIRDEATRVINQRKLKTLRKKYSKKEKKNEEVERIKMLRKEV